MSRSAQTGQWSEPMHSVQKSDPVKCSTKDLPYRDTPWLTPDYSSHWQSIKACCFPFACSALPSLHCIQPHCTLSSCTRTSYATRHGKVCMGQLTKEATSWALATFFDEQNRTQTGFKEAVKVHQTGLTCGAPSAVKTDSADAAQVASASSAGLLAAAPPSLLKLPTSASAMATGLLPRA